MLRLWRFNTKRGRQPLCIPITLVPITLGITVPNYEWEIATKAVPRRSVRNAAKAK
jgi:hypothetical protein